MSAHSQQALVSIPHHRPRQLPWKIVLGASVLGAILLSLECLWLRERQQARKIVWANEQAQSKVATARAFISEQRWDAALRQLEEALAVEGATNRADVQSVLVEAQRGQARNILEAAHIALKHHEADDALRLLRAYLDCPLTEHRDHARLLLGDIEAARSDDRAMFLLGQLSDAALSVFLETGQWTEEDGLHTTVVRGLLQDTLRRNVAKEVRRRESRREAARRQEEQRAAEHASRIRRLSASTAFRELTTYLDRTREQWRQQQQLVQQQDNELNALFTQLGVKDPKEQARLRADLLEGEAPGSIRERVEHQRERIKRAFRETTPSASADHLLFDQLVDQEVAAFLKTLPPE